MLEINFHPFPLLQTERLLLREMTLNDAPAILEMRSNPEVMKYIGRPIMQTIEDAQTWVQIIIDNVQKNESINWAMSLKEAPDLHIGNVSLWRIEKENYRAEIGYMIDPRYQGKGYMSEAVRKVIEYGFKEMKLHSMEACLDPRNLASAAVATKAGFIKEGHFKENYCLRGEFVDSAVYSILSPY